MEISANEMKKYITGYLETFEEDGYTSFSRFLPNQAKLLKDRGHSPKENASAGMKMEFITDGDGFSFKYRVLAGSSQKIFGIDVLIDGIDTYCVYKCEDSYEGELVYNIEKEGTKRVTVYFPNLSKISIKEFCVNGSMEPVKRKLKYLALGDSITQGYVTRHPYLNYVNLLAEKLDADVLNQAIGGDIFYPQSLDEAQKELFMPDIITVAYGTNDWSRGLSLYEPAKAYFSKLRSIYANVRIFALTPIHRNAIQGVIKADGTLEDARQMIKKAAEECGVTVIDGNDLVPHSEDYYCDKNLHPNELGFVFYAENLFREIKKYL